MYDSTVKYSVAMELEVSENVTLVNMLDGIGTRSTVEYRIVKNNDVVDQPSFGSSRATHFAWTAPKEGSLATASIVPIK